MKTIIAGGREFNDFFLLTTECSKLDITEVVCGLARGADSLGAEYAADNFIITKDFPADWDKHGRAAGPIRNKEMGIYADQAIVFWDGKSKGSKHMIDTMKKLGKPVTVVIYE
jgi:hypothetical protein